MRKLKSHRGAAKRFKATAGGKFKRHHSFGRHILTSKARKRKRKLVKSALASHSDENRIRMMLPYA